MSSGFFSQNGRSVAFLEIQGNPKRRRGSDAEYTNPTNHSLDTIIAKPAKRNKEFTGEYAKPNTTATSHGDTPASGSGNAASLTGEYAVPNTTATPQGHNPDVGNRDTASLPAIEEEKNVRTTTSSCNVMRTTHGFQNQTVATNDVTPKTESGTPPRHQTEASLENHRNPTTRRGTDGEYTDLNTTTTLLGDIDTLTNTTTSQPNPKRCIPVGSETYAVTSQPGTMESASPQGYHIT